MVGVWVEYCYDPNMMQCHKNGIVTDNHCTNLGWITRKKLGKKIGGREIGIVAKGICV